MPLRQLVRLLQSRYRRRYYVLSNTDTEEIRTEFGCPVLEVETEREFLSVFFQSSNRRYSCERRQKERHRTK